jgi:hypothetical protein
MAFLNFSKYWCPGIRNETNATWRGFALIYPMLWRAMQTFWDKLREDAAANIRQRYKAKGSLWRKAIKRFGRRCLNIFTSTSVAVFRLLLNYDSFLERGQSIVDL